MPEPTVALEKTTARLQESIYQASMKHAVDERKLLDRVERVRYYQEQHPGTSDRDAIRAVLNTDYDRLPKSQQTSRPHFARAMMLVLQQTAH